MVVRWNDLHILRTKFQPLTPSDMSVATKPFHLPRIIIKEGIINHNELSLLGKDEIWLYLQIKKENVATHDILLATVDYEENVTTCLYR